MRASMRVLQELDSFAQSPRLGARSAGSFTSSSRISSRLSPTRCANTMNATLLITGRAKRRCPDDARSELIRPRSS